MTATENISNQSVTNDDIIKDGSLNMTTSSIGDVTNHFISNNEIMVDAKISISPTLEFSSKKKTECRDISGRSTCVLQRTTSDSGLRLSSFACDSKSCISDFLQASM